MFLVPVMKWKKFLLLLWATASVCGAAQISPADGPAFTDYGHTPLPQLEEDHWAPPPASTTDSNDTEDNSLDHALRHREPAAYRFQWKPAPAQYLLEISIQHGWRFAHEKGTRDATANGPSSTTGSIPLEKPEDGMMVTAGTPATWATRFTT